MSGKDAEGLYAAHLDAIRRTGAGDPEFEALCEDHPELADELRSLKADWVGLSCTLSSAAGDRALSVLLSLSGDGVEPGRGPRYQDQKEIAAGLLSLSGEGDGRDRGPRYQDQKEIAAGLLSLSGEGVGLDRGPRYQDRKEIAAGGMGVICRVFDTRLRRVVAMKSPHPDELDSEGWSTRSLRRQRFLNEARITGQLDHPGIVPVHELGSGADGQPFFTMRMVTGRSLDQILAQVDAGSEEWNRTRVLGVILEICEGMSFAHSRSVVHRDLKPANIMVGRFGETYVMDWGLARRMHAAATDGQESLATAEDLPVDSGPALTVEGDVLGTPSYMSPEQAAGRLEEIGPATDIYAVGAILYRLLAGHAPYGDDPDRSTAREVLDAVRGGPPRPIRQCRPGLPTELVSICDKAMSYALATRYSQMREMADDLRAYLEGRVVLAHEAGAWAELRKWIGRNRATASALAGVFLLAVVGLAMISVIQDRAAAAAREEQQKAEQAGRRVAEANVDLERARSAAQAQAELARQRFEQVLRLSDMDRLSGLRARAADLWPARQALLNEYETWLEDARQLTDRLDAHRHTLARLDAALDRSEPVDLTEGSERWWLQLQRELVTELESFIAERPYDGTIADIEGRLVRAREIRSRTIDDHRRAWQRTLEGVRTSPLYKGLEIEPQVGLVPLGPDPDSGLYEFGHVESGRVPERDAAGVLQFDEESGLVLILVPGGSFRMGAAPPDPEQPAGPNIDPLAGVAEGPVHDIELDPFLISKFEATQGQWRRLTGKEPAYYAAGKLLGEHRVTSLAPVESVAWIEVDRVLRQVELSLPTEAQWEYSARAGTTTSWWTGSDMSSLRGAANLADLTLKESGAPADWAFEDWHDGWPGPAPVGQFRPNPFGLHDVHGNLAEMVYDGHLPYTVPARPGDGQRPLHVDGLHGLRGGAYAFPALELRVSKRDSCRPDARMENSGVRPARRLRR